MSEYVKIHIAFPQPSDYSGETIWAVRIGDADGHKRGLYRIENIPFFADNIGFGDIVICDESNPMKIPEYVVVHTARDTKSGIVVFSDGTPNSIQVAIIDELKAAGARIERGRDTLWVFDVDAVNVRPVEVILDARNQLGQLRFEYNKF